jgi:hypothetical protein
MRTPNAPFIDRGSDMDQPCPPKRIPPPPPERNNTRPDMSHSTLWWPSLLGVYGLFLSTRSEGPGQRTRIGQPNVSRVEGPIRE